MNKLEDSPLCQSHHNLHAQRRKKLTWPQTYQNNKKIYFTSKNNFKSFPERKPSSLAVTPPPPAPGNHWPAVCVRGFTWMFHTEESEHWPVATHLFPVSTLSGDNRVFGVHPCCSLCQLHSFYGWIIFPCPHREILFHSPADEHQGCFHILTSFNAVGVSSLHKCLCGHFIYPWKGNCWVTRLGLNFY